MSKAKRETFASWYKEWVEYAEKQRQNNIHSLESNIKSQKERIENTLVGWKKTNRFKSDYGIWKEAKENIPYWERNIKDYQKQLDILLNAKEVPANRKPNQVYEKLLNHSQINSLIVDGTMLRVSTIDLECGAKDWKDRTLGRFQITIRAGYAPRIENLNWVVEGSAYGPIHHPHVRAQDICMGDFRSSIDSAIKYSQLFLLVDTLIHFLLLANNEDDAYCGWNSFFNYRKELK